MLQRKLGRLGVIQKHTPLGLSYYTLIVIHEPLNYDLLYFVIDSVMHVCKAFWSVCPHTFSHVLFIPVPTLSISFPFPDTPDFVLRLIYTRLEMSIGSWWGHSGHVTESQGSLLRWISVASSSAVSQSEYLINTQRIQGGSIAWLVFLTYVSLW